MIEIQGNLWEIKADAKCITTNGYVKTNGEAVMGRGIALQAKNKFPNLPSILGKHIKEFGNVPGLLSYTGQFSIVSFPVKHNWNENADTDLIIDSAQILMGIVNKFRWDNVLLPRPGCGNGKLRWEHIKPFIVDILDDRIKIVTL